MNLYLTRHVSYEQILIYNDGLGTVGLLPCSGAERQMLTCQLGDLILQPFGY